LVSARFSGYQYCSFPFLFPLVVTSSEKLMISQGLTIFEGTISKVNSASA